MARQALRLAEGEFVSETIIAEEFESLPADALIDRLLAENAAAAQRGSVCITCSFQAEDMIVLALLRQRLPSIPVLFLDTGYHFAETYAYRDRMAAQWKLNVRNLAAKKSVAQQEAEFGILNRTDPGRCCHLRKVEPLFEALEKFRRVVHGTAARAITDAQEFESGRASRVAERQGVAESQSTRGVDLGASLGGHRASQNRLPAAL